MLVLSTAAVVAPVATSTAGAVSVPGQSSGYWLMASDGGIFSYGDAAFHGSTGAMQLNQPIVGMAPTPSGAGYWLVASDGGIFSFGDAGFLGSTGAITLNQPIVGMATTPSGAGYWLRGPPTAASSPSVTPTASSDRRSGGPGPRRGHGPDAVGHGYWMAAQDGSVFAFGDAVRLRSTPEAEPPIVGMTATPTGRGLLAGGHRRRDLLLR